MKILLFRMLGWMMILWPYAGMAQEDLLDLLESEMKPSREFIDATFKSTRVINCHSVERMQAGDLDFRVAHRFGMLKGGLEEFFGLDESSSHVSLELGITDWMMVGAGRATYDKMFNGFVKLSPLRQARGKWPVPFTVSFYLSAMGTNKTFPDPSWEVDRQHRMSYCTQLLVARKFTPWLSLQVSPTWVHKNMVALPEDPNRLFALGMGGRLKFTPRTALTVEYFKVYNRELLSGPTRYNPLSVGVDIETGSHVFQIFLTNTFAIVENGFIFETTRSWSRNEIHLGFNITRVFTILPKRT